MSLRIGIDLDGVCYQWSKTARYMLREILPNSPYTKDGPLGEESTYWEHIPDSVDAKHWRWLWKEGVKLGMFRHGHLFPGTIKALRKLDELGRLIAVTQRPETAAEDTFAWINFHRLPFREVHVLHGGSKTVVAPCDFFIDDKPENCEELAEAWPECRVFIPQRPWNTKFISPRVERVFSWDEFVSSVAVRKRELKQEAKT